MEDYNFRESCNEPIIEYEVKINKKFETFFDLSYMLVDFQALINGITKLYEDDRIFKHGLEAIPKYIEPRESYEIEDIVEKNLVDVDRITKNRLIDEITSLVYPAEKVKSFKPLKPYPTTSRNFGRRYKNQIELQSFEQGCFAATITSTVIAGVILKFIERIIFNEGGSSKIVVNSSKTNIYILDEKSGKRIYKIESENPITNIDDLNNSKTIDEYFNNVVDRVNIDSNNLESSVRNLVNVLVEEEILHGNAIYDDRGIITITKDVERMRGNLLDIRV